LLFLQQIISGRPAKPAETLGCARSDDQKTAKKQRRQGEEPAKVSHPHLHSPPAATSYSPNHKYE
jgi:hypothetical protein